MIPLLAIVGRPNVGKSTLFNRLLGRRKAIVQDDPGVTRDRHYGQATIGGRQVTLVDTGGFEPEAQQGMEALIRTQTELAIAEADLILHVVDARQGLVETDKLVAGELRRSGKPTLLVANKVDGPRQEHDAAGEFYRLGVPEVYAVSAEHGLGLEELADALLAALPLPAEQPSSAASGAIQLALVGRPNAGKSSLLNRLVGQERSIVSDQPGTTRDPVDVRIETPAGVFDLVDTAGIRRKKRSGTAMEKFAIIRALNSVSRAQVACLVIDAAAGVAEQDAKIAGLALEAGRGLVLTFTKMDLLPPGRQTQRQLQEQVADKLQFISFAPVLFLSSRTGEGVPRLLKTVARVQRSCEKRVSTAELNRFLQEAATAHRPPVFRGRPVNFYYITQPQACPPTFLISTNYSQGIHLTYRRYLANRLRERFGFEGTPLRLFFRKRTRKDDAAS